MRIIVVCFARCASSYTMSCRVLVVVLLVLLAMASLAAASNDCKKVLRTVYFERCHARIKRDSGPLVDDDYDGGLPSELHRHAAVKRQIMSFREIFVASGMPPPPPAYHHRAPPAYPGSYYPAVPPSEVDHYRTWQQQQPQQPSRLAFLPQESHSEVGFDMSHEEMMELLEELYERMPRGAKSREDVQKEFLPLFEECCKNIEVCRMKKDCPYN